MKTELQVLETARELIEKGWTRGAEARDEYGNAKGWKSKKAVCFCAIGAIWKADGKAFGPVGDLAQYTLVSCIRTPGIAQWNDSPRRTKKQVLAAFDRAIVKAEKEARQ
jgi:hypothetical protein